MPALDYYNPTLPPDHQFSVNELPSEAQARLRAQFAPLLRFHRRQALTVILLIVLGTVAVVVGAVFHWVLWAVLVCYLTALTMALRLPELLCPNCRTLITKPRGEFCPRCAKRAVMPRGVFFPPKCQACARSVSPEANYPIHACSNCGLWLDDRGIVMK